MIFYLVYPEDELDSSPRLRKLKLQFRDNIKETSSDGVVLSKEVLRPNPTPSSDDEWWGRR